MRRSPILAVATAVLISTSSCGDDGPWACDAVRSERAALVEPSADEAWNDIGALEEYLTQRFDLDERAAAVGC